MAIASVAVVVALFLGLLYVGRGYWAWVAPGAVALLAWLYGGVASPVLFVLCAAALGALAVVFGAPARRRALVTARVFPTVKAILPRLGETERIALEAGTVWWDRELFSGKPAWRTLLDFPVRPLDERAQAFLDGPVEQLCGMLDDWQIAQDRDLPPEVWDFLKEHRFFGMIVPEAYGGLGFSATAHSAVITKLASRSVTAAVTAMVPNSLGPAELLLHYGTEEQKESWLPRLARGEEMPCFALTGPEAGSDAAATQSIGVVCRDVYDGEVVLGMRLNWRKRYITLGPVSTVIGLAFRLTDPDGLLGDTEDLGITCALVPSNLPGIEIGKRHDPMGLPFHNGPNQGHDVFVPLDAIIGGREQAGRGWRMLMETLAAGRCISLPALSLGAVQLSTRVVGAYATVREQFDTPIGRFEGIEEPLARIGGYTYLMNATRLLSVAAVDAGERPAVVSAIVKAYLTEGMRRVVNDAMDIRAGAAICLGPRNILGRAYMAVPVGITVEGANILTRSMIVYGQGAIRCHPYALEEIHAAGDDDLERFDGAFFAHVGFVFQMAVRAFLLGLTNGRLAPRPTSGRAGELLRPLTRLSAAFALTSDVCMATLGGQLKRREKITGRLADALAWLYLASAAVKRFADDGQPERDRPFAEWSVQHAVCEIEGALLGVIENLPNRPAAWFLRAAVFPFGARAKPPSDRLGSAVARRLLEDHEARRQLTRDIYIPPADEPGLGRLEAALAAAVDGLAVETKIRDAVREGRIDKAPGDMLAAAALAAGIITRAELELIHEADAARDEAIQVDAFEPGVFAKAAVR